MEGLSLFKFIEILHVSFIGYLGKVGGCGISNVVPIDTEEKWMILDFIRSIATEPVAGITN